MKRAIRRALLLAPKPSDSAHFSAPFRFLSRSGQKSRIARLLVLSELPLESVKSNI
jgi:hypothetical protein